MADVIDFSSAQDKKKHDLKDQQAQELRDRFSKAMGMDGKPKRKSRKSTQRGSKRPR